MSAETIERAAVSIERDGAVATIVLCRPHRRNALDLDAWIALREAVLELQEDAQINLPVRLRKVPHFKMRVQKYVPELKALDLSEDFTERRAQLQAEGDRLRTRMQELFDSLA